MIIKDRKTIKIQLMIFKIIKLKFEIIYNFNK